MRTTNKRNDFSIFADAPLTPQRPARHVSYCRDAHDGQTLAMSEAPTRASVRCVASAIRRNASHASHDYALEHRRPRPHPHHAAVTHPGLTSHGCGHDGVAAATASDWIAHGRREGASSCGNEHDLVATDRNTPSPTTVNSNGTNDALEPLYGCATAGAGLSRRRQIGRLASRQSTPRAPQGW